MRVIKFFVSLAITTAVIILGNTGNPIGSSIPALGRFFSPSHGFWQQAEKVNQKADETITLDGFTAPVKVIMDSNLVPHIYAQNSADAYQALGYLHARYRLFQMDISSRSALGRIAELIGEDAVEYDKNRRRLGMELIAENFLKKINSTPTEKNILDAYVRGVNQWIAQLAPRDYPLEYKLLGAAPQPWTHLQSASVLSNFCYTLCFRHSDLQHTNLRQALGDSLFQSLYPEVMNTIEPIIPAGTLFVSEEEKVGEEVPAKDLGLLPYKPLSMPDEHLGSNNWAIGVENAKNGAPILASDPHLNLTLPSIWYQVHLRTSEINAHGITTPGAPFLPIGFNENTAWGITNAGWDVLDWYTINWADEQHQQYYLDGKKMSVENKITNIKVKGGKTVKDTIKYTYWGPVVYESEESAYNGMAMRWMPLDESRTTDYSEIGVFDQFVKGATYENHRKALLNFRKPPQNFVFASQEGDISLTVSGSFPIKKEKQGRFIQDGSQSLNDWEGFIPPDRVPATLNPEQGYVASANQHPTDSLYPYYYNGGFATYRARIINRYLRERQDVSLEDVLEMQNDNYSILAEEALPVLLTNLEEAELAEGEKQYYEWLKKWDYNYEMASRAAVLFSRWYDEFNKIVYDEIQGLRDSLSVQFPKLWRTTELINEYPSHIIFDRQETPEIETLEEIALASFKTAVAEYDKEPERQTWYGYRNTIIRHIANIPGLSSQVLKTGGFRYALNALSSSSGPSWRMVVELAASPNAYGIYPGGQSGNPGSFYYDNFIEKYAKGAYNKLELAAEPSQVSNPMFTINFNK